MLYTFQDAIFHILDFCGADASAKAIRTARLAAKDALRELHTATQWSYLYTLGRLVTSAPYNTGTISYDHTGNGAGERVVLLTGGTFPTWALYGTVVIANVMYDVEKRISGTTLQLTEASNPGADVAASTTYSLFRDQYQLAENFRSTFNLHESSTHQTMEFVHPKDWNAARTRLGGNSTGTPYIFTITGDPHRPNRLVLRTYPYPTEALNYDHIYMRKPGDLNIFEYKTGTVSTTATSATLTGIGTSWNSTYEGIALRISATDTTIASGVAETGPYGFDRNAYYIHETIVDSVTNATTLVMKDVATETLSSVRYVLSDIVDIEGEAMLIAFQRLCEKHVAIKNNMEGKGDYLALARQALKQAMEADVRAHSLRSRRDSVPYRSREWDVHAPLGGDVT